MKGNYFESRIQTINQVRGQIKDIFQHETTQNFRLQTWTRCAKKKLFKVVFQYNAKQVEERR